MGSLLFAHNATASDDLLARASQLYQNAAYEEALQVLEQIDDSTSAHQAGVDAYRAFCLIALRRTEEARTAIERLIDADPFYRLPPDEASPHVRSLFNDVRRAALPALVARAYADAKSAFERKDQDAGSRFERVLALLNDSDIAEGPESAGLRIAATGFLDLINASARPSQPELSVPDGPAATSTPITPVHPVIPAAPATAVYLETDPRVVAPVPISQIIPRVQTQETLPAWQREGRIEVVIDENGSVLSARVLARIHPAYDQLLVKAAMSWKYVPGRKDGIAVRVRKIVTVQVVPD
jgi:tetratricopeptide (TPR) repeat protein